MIRSLVIPTLIPISWHHIVWAGIRNTQIGRHSLHFQLLPCDFLREYKESPWDQKFTQGLGVISPRIMGRRLSPCVLCCFGIVLGLRKVSSWGWHRVRGMWHLVCWAGLSDWWHPNPHLPSKEYSGLDLQGGSESPGEDVLGWKPVQIV